MRECYLTLGLKYLHQNQGVHQAGSVWSEGFSEAFQHSWFSSLHLSYTVEDTYLQVTKRPQHIMLFQQYYTASRGQKGHNSTANSRTTAISIPPSYGRPNKRSSNSLTLFSFWWSQLLQVYMKVLFHSSICYIA